MDNQEQEKSSKKNDTYFDEKEAAFRRLSLTFQEYESNYNNFLVEFEDKTDGDEVLFVENELSIFEETNLYLSLSPEERATGDYFQVFQFEQRYKRYLNYLNNIVYSFSDKIDFSLERKCRYLRYRKLELESSPVHYTLDQRLLLLKYLALTDRIKLLKIHPDNTGQAKILHFLMNASFQKTRAGLGKKHETKPNARDLRILLKLLDEQSYFDDVIELIKKDLVKLS